MTRKEIIDGLKMTMGLILFDPSTGEDIDPDNLNDLNRTTYDACKGAVELLETQEKIQLSEEDATSDTISRQNAIDAVKKHYRAHDNDLLELIAFDIERLPPAQPELIMCKDCKFADREATSSNGMYWCIFHGSYMRYCSDAVRKTDTDMRGAQE